MKTSRPRVNPVQERPKQKLPEEVVHDLMRVVQNQFFPDSFSSKEGAKRWGQDRHFILRRVILWPASWLNNKGVTLKPERYQAILLEVFNEIKSHGKTDAVKYWPGYLAKCVQERFMHRSEEIYNEGKALRTSLENAILGLKSLSGQPDIVSALAQSKRVLDSSQRKKASKPQADQLSLL